MDFILSFLPLVYIIVGFTLLSLVFQGVERLLNWYAGNRLRALWRRAQMYVYYYIENYELFDFYYNKDKWLAHNKKFIKTYNKLIKRQNKWYARRGNPNQVKLMLDFFETASFITFGSARYFEQDHYYTFSEWDSLRLLYERMNQLTTDLGLNTLINVQNYAQLREKHNAEFIEKELKNNKVFFDMVLNYPLDQQQRLAIVKLDDNCQVISSAGSGKTSTSIAKVKYLLNSRNLGKEEILVLSYNRKTAAEFDERLNVPGVTCKTFHALALAIIGQVEKARPAISEAGLLVNCYYDLIKEDALYKDNVTHFFGELSSLTKNEHQYYIAKKYYDDRAKYGITAPYSDMNGRIIYTRSEEEKKICTWLTVHGVKFLYEQPYPYPTADQDHRQYKPDFTIYYTLNGQPCSIYLEHFAIDYLGRVPKWFGEGTPGGFRMANKRYNEGIIWKRNIHQLHHTRLLETTSAMFRDGNVFDILAKQLRDAGVPMRELSSNEKYDLLFKRNLAMEDNVKNLFSSFITLMKANQKSFDDILNAVKLDGDSNFFKRNEFLLLKVIKPLYEKYESTLKMRNEVDYTDLILHAAELCEERQWVSPYKFILVDEFQDLSVDRCRLLKALRKDVTRTKLFCVGDDWQSIYRFSGSDLNLFNHIEQYFGFVEKCKIETTYRFGNPLLEMSSKFILKNEEQVMKNVKPFSEALHTKLTFVPFMRENGRQGYLINIMELIELIPTNETVMLIGRYRYDVDVFPKESIHIEGNGDKTNVTFAGRTMPFFTIHRAKGLEADHVILLNCSQDKGGFPSRVSDDPILGYVLSKTDTYQNSEERRLFYVATTRAKKHTYVMYNKEWPSEFVIEMMEQGSKDLMRCPHCQKGMLKLMKEGVAKDGKRYRFYACGNTVSGCTFTWNVFFDDESEVITQYHQSMDNYFKECKQIVTINGQQYKIDPPSFDNY